MGADMGSAGGPSRCLAEASLKKILRF